MSFSLIDLQHLRRICPSRLNSKKHRPPQSSQNSCAWLLHRPSLSRLQGMQQDALSGMRGRIPDGAEGNTLEVCGATLLWLLTAYRLGEWVSDSMDQSFSMAYGGIWNAFF